MIRHFVVIFLLVSIFLFGVCYSQKRADLEKSRKQKLEEIEKVEELLKKTENDKFVTTKKMELLNQKIQLRHEIIIVLNQEINEFENNIVSLNGDIGKRNDEINMLKVEYSKIVYSNYYHFKSFNMLLFVIASNSFNQAYRRFNYLKQFTTHRKNILKNILNEVNDLETNVSDLKIAKEKKFSLLSQRENEAKHLEFDKVQQKDLIKFYASEEKKLKKQLIELQEATKKIEKEIERIIREEALAKIKRSKKVLKEELKLTSDFGGNKGKLPWPVINGRVVSFFGEHEHPLFKGIVIKNNGIDISTGCDVEVHVVFGGIVSKIFAIKGANFAIIIRHGDYLTVYQNIQNINVKIGEKVSANQVIGKSYCTNGENISNVHFELWHELKKSNPLDWLKK